VDAACFPVSNTGTCLSCAWHRHLSDWDIELSVASIRVLDLDLAAARVRVEAFLRTPRPLLSFSRAAVFPCHRRDSVCTVTHVTHAHLVNLLTRAHCHLCQASLLHVVFVIMAPSTEVTTYLPLTCRLCRWDGQLIQVGDVTQVTERHCHAATTLHVAVRSPTDADNSYTYD